MGSPKVVGQFTFLRNIRTAVSSRGGTSREFSLGFRDGAACVINRIGFVLRAVVGDALDNGFGVVAAGESAFGSGAQRADALCGDDRDALRLARETEEFLISGRVAFANGCEVLVFVAKEENLPEILLRVRPTLIWPAREQTILRSGIRDVFDPAQRSCLRLRGTSAGRRSLLRSPRVEITIVSRTLLSLASGQECRGRPLSIA
jgi:hypothetical protein